MYLDQSVSKGIVTTTSDFAPGIQAELGALMPDQIGIEKWDGVEGVAEGT